MKKVELIVLIAMAILTSCNNENKKEQQNNPLLSEFLTPFQVPPFDSIKPHHFVPAFEFAMKQQNEEILAIVNNAEEADYMNTVEAYMNSGELLQSVHSIFSNTNGANTNAEIQKIAEEINPKIAAHEDEISLNPKLFERIKKVYDNRESYQINEEQSFLLERIYQSFAKRGALLSDTDKEKLKKINQELSTLTTKFDQNLLAETNAFQMIVDKKEDLAGLPESVISAAEEAANAQGHQGKWLFTTHKPSMIPFLQYAQNRSLREKIYQAYTNRGNNNNANDNKEILKKIVMLRADKAVLLGYKDYATFRLEDRMAKSPENALKVLNELWQRSLVVAKKESAELQQIIDKEKGGFKIAGWDWMYYAEKLRAQKYNLDENELRPYFKLENVVEGVFTVSQKLYGLTFEKREGYPLPHPDATAYEVKEEDGRHLGVIYLDFFPRESKDGGAWCGEYRSHYVKNEKKVTPVTTVVCNFTKPTKDAPSLLSMDEVETLFHEFGHALESLMSNVSYRTTFVARDFVELPSQIFEHWAFDGEVIKMYAKHYQTNEVMPDELINKIKNSSLFNQGFATTEYMAASLLDLEYHQLKQGQDIDILKFESDFFTKIGLIPEVGSRYRSTYFAHIVGGYDAAYYGYIWAGILDNDAFETFKEKGIFDRATANSFRKNILEKDGIEDPVKMYVNFKGREAVIEPLLKNRGLL
jgi:peptidyl-dipeptidase Dcp